MNTIEKMPNWLRYILAIPFGIICAIFIAVVFVISNWLYSTANWTYILNFLYKNGINVIVFFYGVNIMLPNFKFQVTLAISIIVGILYSILEGMSIMENTLTIEFIIAYLEFIICLIVSCYCSFNKKFE